MFSLTKNTPSGLHIFVPPHMKVAQPVVNENDIFKEAKEISNGMVEDTFLYPNTLWKEAIAIAQPQVSGRPLRYFVINPKFKDLIAEFGGQVIVNPHLDYKDKLSKFMFKDACMSYPLRPAIKVKRYSRITASYDIIVSLKADKPEIKKFKEKQLTELAALVFQHELEHLNGKSLFDR